MCQSPKFVVTPEEKNLFSNNDKNAKNESISVCHIRSKLLSHGSVTFCRRCFIGVAFEKICCDCEECVNHQSLSPEIEASVT